MKNGLVIADSGPIFSLAIVDKLDLLDKLFDDVKIPQAVWKEITLDESTLYYARIREFFKDKVCQIKGFNELTFVMDYGESESVILYKEIEADFLLIDDKKARRIAENFEINCIGTIGILSISKQKGFLTDLRSIFKEFLKNRRYYSLSLLNSVLNSNNEELLDSSI